MVLVTPFRSSCSVAHECIWLYGIENVQLSMPSRPIACHVKLSVWYHPDTVLSLVLLPSRCYDLFYPSLMRRGGVIEVIQGGER
jgi:hypothetical protein